MELSMILLVLTAVVSCLEVNAVKEKKRCKTPPQNMHVSWDPARHVKEDIRCPRKSLQYKRTSRLYSEASGGHLQILSSGRVDGRGREGSQYVKLSIESVTFGEVRIRGVNTGLFLCINKKGKLRAQRKRSRVMRNKKCKFTELEFNGYFMYRSVKFPQWFVAVNRRGKASKATFERRLRAKLFVQRPYDKKEIKKKYKFNQKRIMKKLRKIQRRRF